MVRSSPHASLSSNDYLGGRGDLMEDSDEEQQQDIIKSSTLIIKFPMKKKILEHGEGDEGAVSGDGSNKRRNSMTSERPPQQRRQRTPQRHSTGGYYDYSDITANPPPKPPATDGNKNQPMAPLQLPPKIPNHGSYSGISAKHTTKTKKKKYVRSASHSTASTESSIATSSCCSSRSKECLVDENDIKESNSDLDFSAFVQERHVTDDEEGRLENETYAFVQERHVTDDEEGWLENENKKERPLDVKIEIVQERAEPDKSKDEQEPIVDRKSASPTAEMRALEGSLSQEGQEALLVDPDIKKASSSSGKRQTTSVLLFENNHNDNENIAVNKTAAAGAGEAVCKAVTARNLLEQALGFSKKNNKIKQTNDYKHLAKTAFTQAVEARHLLEKQEKTPALSVLVEDNKVKGEKAAIKAIREKRKHQLLRTFFPGTTNTTTTTTTGQKQECLARLYFDLIIPPDITNKAEVVNRDKDEKNNDEKKMQKRQQPNRAPPKSSQVSKTFIDATTETFQTRSAEDDVFNKAEDNLADIFHSMEFSSVVAEVTKLLSKNTSRRNYNSDHKDEVTTASDSMVEKSADINIPPPEVANGKIDDKMTKVGSTSDFEALVPIERTTSKPKSVNSHLLKGLLSPYKFNNRNKRIVRSSVRQENGQKDPSREVHKKNKRKRKIMEKKNKLGRKEKEKAKIAAAFATVLANESFHMNSFQHSFPASSLGSVNGSVKAPEKSSAKRLPLLPPSSSAPTAADNRHNFKNPTPAEKHNIQKNGCQSSIEQETQAGGDCSKDGDMKTRTPEGSAPDESGTLQVLDSLPDVSNMLSELAELANVMKDSSKNNVHAKEEKKKQCDEKTNKILVKCQRNQHQSTKEEDDDETESSPLAETSIHDRVIKVFSTSHFATQRPQDEEAMSSWSGDYENDDDDSGDTNDSDDTDDTGTNDCGGSEYEDSTIMSSDAAVPLLASSNMKKRERTKNISSNKLQREHESNANTATTWKHLHPVKSETSKKAGLKWMV